MQVTLTRILHQIIGLFNFWHWMWPSQNFSGRKFYDYGSYMVLTYHIVWKPHGRTKHLAISTTYCSNDLTVTLHFCWRAVLDVVSITHICPDTGHYWKHCKLLQQLTNSLLVVRDVCVCMLGQLYFTSLAPFTTLAWFAITGTLHRYFIQPDLDPKTLGHWKIFVEVETLIFILGFWDLGSAAEGVQYTKSSKSGHVANLAQSVTVGIMWSYCCPPQNFWIQLNNHNHG